MSNTLITAVASKATVNPGDTFDLDITVDTDTQTWGAQFDLQFDPKLVEIDSLTRVVSTKTTQRRTTGPL